MAENKRDAGYRGSTMALLIIVEVRPTDANAPNAQKNHSGLKFGAAE